MKTVLVALDQTAEAASVLAHAIELARPLGAQLTLLHVVSVPRDLPPPGSVLMRLPASASELVAAARQHLLLLAADVPEALRPEIVVETGNPASVICTVAQARGADLVVIGAHQHGLVRRVLGTTAARVVNHLDRPVVVVRARESDIADARASRELRAEHERLEKVCAKMTQSYRDDDWSEVQAEWQLFERALRDHMRLEERRMLPAFERANEPETKAILADHAELRAGLSTLGVAIELHGVSEAQIAELLARVRAHSRREESLFYPWLDANPAAASAALPDGELEVTFSGGKRVDVHVGSHLVPTDQPKNSGGNDTAPAPMELFFASLAACAGFYVLAFCQARDLPTAEIRLRQQVEVDPETHLPRLVRHTIELPAAFPEKYRTAIVRAADGCKVKKAIAAAPTIETTAVTRE